MICDAPFRHLVIDNFLTAHQVRELNAAWPVDGWKVEHGSLARKSSTQELPLEAWTAIRKIDPRLVEAVCEEQGLFADTAHLEGAGLHVVPSGGFLEMHVDFNRHSKGWWRRANALLYLNETWKPEWGGELRLGLGSEQKRIEPIGGRLVVFPTTEQSWHGHPDPLACPMNVERRSLALYWYSKTPPAVQVDDHSTVYRKSRGRRKR